MICPRCKVEMKIGITIDGIDSERDNALYVTGGQGWRDYRNLKLVDALKCPSCGYTASRERQLE